MKPGERGALTLYALLVELNLLLAVSGATFALVVPGALFLEPWSAAVMNAPDEPGPLWWVFTPYAYALILAGSALQVWTGAGGGPLGHRSVVIGLAGLLPLGVHAAWTWFGLPGERDPTPLTLGPVGLALASALFPGGLLEVRPLAQHELIERLPLGVVMADRSGAVFDVNPHAERALALPRAELIGRSLDAIVAEAPTSYRVEISEVTLASRPMARFAFLHPPDAAVRERQDAA